jgi:hypothetical protein
MNQFEYLYGLFGIIVGLTVVEVLKGLVETFKCSSPVHCRGENPVRLGWLTPLLGLFVLLDATSLWVNLWTEAASLRVGFASAFGILVTAGLYYFAASLVFPAKPEDWADLDDWFWLQRRQVLGAIFLSEALFTAFIFLYGGGTLGAAVGQGLFFLLLGGAALAPNKWVVGGLLALMCAVFVTIAAIDAYLLL